MSYELRVVFPSREVTYKISESLIDDIALSFQKREVFDMMANGKKNLYLIDFSKVMFYEVTKMEEEYKPGEKRPFWKGFFQ